jgi:hypothetical protein
MERQKAPVVDFAARISPRRAAAPPKKGLSTWRVVTTILSVILCLELWYNYPYTVLPVSPPPSPPQSHGPGVESFNRTVSNELFLELESFARLVDISYCISPTNPLGLSKPFACLHRCDDFAGFELLHTFEDAVVPTPEPNVAGYVAVSHPPWPKRIYVVFRGTYSIENGLVDLLSVPQNWTSYSDRQPPVGDVEPCRNCSVHAGFMLSWTVLHEALNPVVQRAREQFPGHEVHLIGHSLGGAVAALAGLEYVQRGWKPVVTTFGEPRVGNAGLVAYIDRAFKTDASEENRYRRVTHAGDPVPMVPLERWGWKMHAHEVYISAAELSPRVEDVRHCQGDRDPECIVSSKPLGVPCIGKGNKELKDAGILEPLELLFSHRDYFWRLGLCVLGGDPSDWLREYEGAYSSKTGSYPP